MTDDRRIELEVEVTGTPEEVWRAIATGPGISSWYVPHVVEEREGGAAMASFGDGPEMQIPGVVAAWEPPHRIVFTGSEADEGLAFEWLVEARDGGTCVVRLVNIGLRLRRGVGRPVRRHGRGLEAVPAQPPAAPRPLPRPHGHARMLPMAMWPGTREQVVGGAHRRARHPCRAGRRRARRAHPRRRARRSPARWSTSTPWRLALLLDEPAPGTAFLAVEGTGDQWASRSGPTCTAPTAPPRRRAGHAPLAGLARRLRRRANPT